MKITKVFSSFNKKNTLIHAYLVAVLCAFLVAVSFNPVRASATAKSGRWATNSVTTTVDVEASEKELETEADSNPVLDLFSEAIVWLADWVNNALRTGSVTGVDASITGIVMGTATNDDGDSIFVFSLSDSNIYGIIGATIYVALRSLAMMFIFLMTLWAIVKRLFTSKPGQGISDLKQALYDAILFLAFLYYCPYLIDYICVARDYFMSLNVRTAAGLLSDLGGGSYSDISSFVDVYRENYETTKTLGNALVYALVSILPIHFLISYIQIAIQQTVLFGMFPVFCVAGMSDKKSLSGWLSVIASNAFIPALDALLITFALMIKVQIDTMLESWGGTLLSVMMILIMFRSVVPARNKILGLLGGAIGLPMGGGGGFSALAALGSAAIGGASKALGGALGKKGDKEDEPKGGNSDIKSEADKGMENANLKPVNGSDSAEEDKGGGSSESSMGQAGLSEASGGSEGSGESGGSSEEATSGGAGASLGSDGASNDDSIDGGGGLNGEVSSDAPIHVDPSELDATAAGDIEDIQQLAGTRADSMYGEEGGWRSDSENRDAYMNEVADRADNLGKMDTINRENDSIDLENARSKLAISDAQSQMAANTREIEKKEKELAGVTDGDKKAKLQGEIDGLKSANENHQNTIDKHTHDMASREVNKATNAAKLKELDAKEQNFAQKQADRGFNGKAYGSAAEFKADLTKQNNLAASANYKNFKNNEQLQGVLSDKEVKKLSAQAKRHETMKNVAYGAVGGAIGAAGAVAGTTLAYVATAGLDERQASDIINKSAKFGGQVGYAAGYTAPGAAVSGAKATGRTVARGGKAVVKGGKAIAEASKGFSKQTTVTNIAAKVQGSGARIPNNQLKTPPQPPTGGGGGNGRNNNTNARTRMENKAAQQGKASPNGQNSRQNNNTNARTRMENRAAQEAKSNPSQDQFVENYKKMQEESSKRNAEKASKIIRGR